MGLRGEEGVGAVVFVAGVVVVVGRTELGGVVGVVEVVVLHRVVHALRFRTDGFARDVEIRDEGLGEVLALVVEVAGKHQLVFAPLFHRFLLQLDGFFGNGHRFFHRFQQDIHFGVGKQFFEVVVVRRSSVFLFGLFLALLSVDFEAVTLHRLEFPVPRSGPGT